MTAYEATMATLTQRLGALEERVDGLEQRTVPRTRNNPRHWEGDEPRVQLRRDIDRLVQVCRRVLADSLPALGNVYHVSAKQIDDLSLALEAWEEGT